VGTLQRCGEPDRGGCGFLSVPQPGSAGAVTGAFECGGAPRESRDGDDAAAAGVMGGLA